MMKLLRSLLEMTKYSSIIQMSSRRNICKFAINQISKFTNLADDENTYVFLDQQMVT